jgi:WD40 repeat protein
MQNGKLLVLIGQFHPMLVQNIPYYQYPDLLVSGSDDKTIKVWSLSIAQQVCTSTSHIGNVYSVAISADGTTLVSRSQDKTIKVWGA